MKKVLIADDEVNIRNIMSAFLNKNGYETILFDNGEKLLSYLQTAIRSEKNYPNIVCIVLDIMMPGRNGYEICKAIREISTIPIIMVSAKDHDYDKIKGLRIGSDDYLTKPFSPIELVARVEALVRRYHYQNNGNYPIPIEVVIQSKLGNITINEVKKQAICNNEILDLTQTEFTLLSYFVQRQDKAVSREELLINIWNIDINIKTRVIDDTLKRLRKKLKDSNANISIETIWGFGFIIKLSE